MASEYDAQVTALTPPKRHERCVALSERALNALNSMYQELFNCPMPPTTICHPKYAIGKVTFTTRAESKRDCNVFFRSTIGGSIVPGVIQYIISIRSPSQPGKKDLLCVIEQYMQLPDQVALNSFSAHEAFGASLWSSKMSLALEAVPMDHIICHAISRPWVKGAILFKALNRVSTPPLTLVSVWLIHLKAF